MGIESAPYAITRPSNLFSPVMATGNNHVLPPHEAYDDDETSVTLRWVDGKAPIMSAAVSEELITPITTECQSQRAA